MKKLIIVFLALTMSLFAKNYKKKEFDKIFKDGYTKHTPSISVAVIEKGKIIYKKAFGMASLELNVPATTKSVYRIGSLSKQMTASCIVMLEQDGKLSTKDKIINYFPELPAEVYSKITIKQMIYHTSGIRDSENMYPLMNIAFSQWYTHDMLLEMLRRQKGLCFEPGSEYEYSNSAYTLLSLIIEKVSGQKFNEFINEKIFQPLGMENTYIQTSPSTFIPNRTAGYELKEDKYVNWMTNNQLLGHDAVYSSVEDLFLWQQAIEKGKIGEYNLEIMKTPGNFNDGTLGKYGYGLVMGKYRGLDSYCHDGWYVGYKAFFITFPEQKFSVIALGNIGNKSVRAYATKLIDFYLEKYFNSSELQSINKSEQFEKISKHEKYVRTKLGGFKTLESIEKDYFISPWNEKEFCTVNQLTTLEIIEENKKFQLLQTTSYGSKNYYIPFNKIEIEVDEKSNLIGEYFSSELDIKGKIYIDDKKLILEIGLEKVEILQYAKDEFASNSSLIKITRSHESQITGFIFSTYSVRGIIFTKE